MALHVGLAGHVDELLLGGASGVLDKLHEQAIRILEQPVGRIELLQKRFKQNNKITKYIGDFKSYLRSCLDFPIGENHDAIGVHDGVEAVGDGEDGAVLEAVPYRLLNQLISPEKKHGELARLAKTEDSAFRPNSLWVDVGSCFIQD